MSEKKNNLRQAFEEGFNLVGLGGLAAISLATLNPLPFLAGLVAEAAYLLFVPDSQWYMSRLSKKADAEVAARRAELKRQAFPQISEREQRRFEKLEGIRAQLGGQADLQDKQWFREVLRKLDYLLEKLLMFATKESQFRKYLVSVQKDVVPHYRPGWNDPRNDDSEAAIIPVRVVDRRRGKDKRDDKRDREKQKKPAEATGEEILPPLSDNWVNEVVGVIQNKYDSEITDLTEKTASESDLNTKAILDKRVDVLRQRHEYVGKIGKILINLGHQMDLLEDSFGLINDQIRAQSPEQVLADIEGVVYQTDSMTRLLDELAPYEPG